MLNPMQSIRVGGKNGAMRCTFIRVDCMDRHWTVESPDAQRQFPDRSVLASGSGRAPTTSSSGLAGQQKGAQGFAARLTPPPSPPTPPTPHPTSPHPTSPPLLVA